MARYQVILAYDGTDFLGYQRQKYCRTVQGEVEKALLRLGWQGKTILCAGRTDTGVHASGQVIAFDLDWKHTPEDLRNALNAALPVDISTRQVAIASATFHPRYDAHSREYCYRILIDPARNPLTERYTWRMESLPRPDLLEKTAVLFLGCHDFAAFGTPPRPGSTTIRDITLSHWVMEDQRFSYHVRANAFLYHMVRRLAFIQVMAACERFDLSRLEQNLEEGLPDLPGIAPALGLEIVRVEYGDANQDCR
jgi:tRNA pseudouridine38-40 synthase